MYDLTLYPVASLYSVLALVTAGVGVGMIVWQTGATQHALITRRGILVGGVLLILIAGLVGTTQVLAIISGSYAGLPGNVP